MSTQARGVLGVYDGLDATVAAIERLRARGLKRLTVFTPVPSHEIEHALDVSPSPVRLFTLVGGLTGTATGFALPTWTSLDWPQITGGKPIIALPAWVIIAFELTILFGALSTVLGLFILARLPMTRPLVVYDPAFSADRYGLYLEPPAGRETEVREIMTEAGAVEIREHTGEVTVATT
ncbi:MAG: DUF3341 domain-containing protein [Longimicrobiales bacterium]